MATPNSLLKFIAKATLHVLDAGSKDGAVVNVGLMAEVIWLWWSPTHDQAARAAEVAALAQAPNDEIRRTVVQVLGEIAKERPLEVRQMLGTYLTRTVSQIRRALPVPAGPQATATPLSLQRAADLIPFLPPQLPDQKVSDPNITLQPKEPVRLSDSGEASFLNLAPPLDAPAPGGRVTLAVTAGPHKGRVFAFAGHDTFLVGRSKRAHFQLPIKDKFFSRIHFMVEVNPPHCRLMDMGSRNGTFVNDQPVTTADLHHGDKIQAGRTVLRIMVEHGDATSAPATGTSGEDSQRTQTVAGNSPVPAPVSLIKPVPPPLQPPHIPSVVRPAPPPTPVPSVARSVPPLPVVSPFDESSVRTVLPVAPPAQPPPPPPVMTAPVFTQPAAPPPMAIPVANPGTCLGCGGSLRSTRLAGSLALCNACQEESKNQPQPVAGFQVIRELGKGGMGVVYLALRQSDSALVALKTTIPAVAGTSAQIERFLREARILEKLNHANIVAFREMGESAGQLYFAMDYVQGVDAGKLLKKNGPLPVPRAVNLVCQLLDALDYAHAQNFVHRDIKPANLLVTNLGNKELVKLADFGLARAYQASQLSGLTMMGEMGGTVAFMAPEQITHYRESKPPVDQYAASATLYNLLTGHFIYDMTKNIQQQLLLILQEKPVPILARRGDIPAALADIIHKALDRDAGNRYADAKSLRKALLKFCQ